MRPVLILFLLAFLITSCNMNVKTTEAPFSLDSLMTYDYQGLEKLFGTDKLKDSTVQNIDSQLIRYTLVMPGTKTAVRLQWTDSTRTSIDFATIYGTSSSWKTRDSVTLGMPMVELEKINGTPFYFYNDTYEPNKMPDWAGGGGKPGYIMTWGTDGNSKPKLFSQIDKIKLNASIKPPSNGDQSGIFASNNPLAIENNPVVIEVTLSRMNLPINISIEDVVITKTTNIPHATSFKPDDRVDKINQVILEYFQLKSFDPSEDFAWSNLSFDTEDG